MAVTSCALPPLGPRNPPLSTSSILIFVVDDEPLIHDLLETALHEGGFEVTSASSGEEAIAILDSKIADIRALITDVNLLPGKLTGWDVGRHARELNADLPVVYMTGASAHEWSSKGVPNSVLLTKPFAPAQVVTAVAQLLNNAPGPG